MASLYITVTFVTFAKSVFRVKVAVFIIADQSGFGSGPGEFKGQVKWRPLKVLL